MDKKIPEALCKLPWSGISNDPDGRTRPCCIYKGHISDSSGIPYYLQKSSMNEIFHSAYMKELRQQFREHKKPSGCATCWEDEKNGYTSKRQRHLAETDINKIIEIKEVWQREPDSLPADYQLIISNACNLKCRSCAPSHSTQWQAEVNPHLAEHQKFKMPFGQAGNETSILWQDRMKWYPSIKRLEIVGGEPFFIKQWTTILTELMDLNLSKNIMLNLSTNCTHINIEFLKRMVSEFKHVGIGLSIDGIGAVYEYMRHPAKWDVVYSNLKKYHGFLDEYYFNQNSREKRSIDFSFNVTVSWLNAWYLPELHTVVKNEFNHFDLWLNVVHAPSFLALWSAPTELKKAIESKWNSYSRWGEQKDTISGMLTFMKSQETTLRQQKRNIEKIRETDLRRKEQFEVSLNEISHLVNRDYSWLEKIRQVV